MRSKADLDERTSGSPQCLCFSDGSNTRSTWRFNARITPIRANIVWPVTFHDQQYPRNLYRNLPE
jgi:hypothetical protein